MTVFCYITFPTTYFALRAESLLKESEISFKMVPVPRSISSSCGIALRCGCPELSRIEQLLEENQAEMESSYRIEEKDFSLPRLFSRREGSKDE